MKNIKLNKRFTYRAFAGMFVVLAALVSCDDDLNVEPSNVISEEDYLNNPDNAIQLVNGVYNKMLDYNMYSFSWIGMTSITSDDADKGSTASDTGSDKHKMDNLTFDSQDISFQDVWKGRYEGVYRANNALYYVDLLQADPALKNRLVGEVKFLRSFWYFDLVRCFGGVPLVLEKIDLNDTEAINEVVFTKKTKEEVYAQIETDLLDAIDRLPTKSQYGANDLGRATKGAAQALLAKVYLYEKKWAEAYNMAGNVISSGEYDLMPSYADVWREVGENKEESVFEVQATLTMGIRDYTNVQGPRGTPDLGWGFNIPSQALVNSYAVGDVRKNATVMVVPSTLWDGFIAPTGWTNPRYNYKAYQSSIAESWNGDKGNTAKNLRLLKYSDVLLIRAEAGYQAGMTSDLEDIMHQIRERAGLGDLDTITLQDIYNERRWEMAMEHERWFDIVRTGQGPAAMSAVGKTFITGKHELFPIPQAEIATSGGRLIQNNGY